MKQFKFITHFKHIFAFIYNVEVKITVLSFSELKCERYNIKNIIYITILFYIIYIETLNMSKHQETKMFLFETFNIL